MNGRATRYVPYLLAFFSSLCIMILELVASRLVARHVGASLSVWTSVIGIMLGGICLGNVLGGKLADRIDPSRALEPLYALGSALTLAILAMNSAVGYLPGRTSLPLSLDTLLVVTLDFLVPGTVLGMISPIVAKIAVERARRSGGALGDVYFSGAVGSIAGTFLAGFVLIYLAPTSTIVLLVAAGLLFVGGVLVREGELSGGTITAALLAVALAVGAVGLAVTGYSLRYNDGTPNAQAVQVWANRIFLVSLVVLGAAFVSAALASFVRSDTRAIAATAAVALLGLGSVETMGGRIRAPGIMLGATKVNALAIGGALIAFGLAVDAVMRLKAARREADALAADPVVTLDVPATDASATVSLRDLAILAFISSLAFMTLEMVAGRLVTRNLGSSIYGWTSVIGVLLGGLSLGNWLGGRIANRVSDESKAATLFLVASILTLGVILAETPREWMVRNPIGYFFYKEPGRQLASGEPGKPGPILGAVSGMNGWPWELRILIWVSIEFLLPAAAMGTIGPVVAKLAVERVRTRTKGTGAAIGSVYAWGMVGSILGTFLAGFLLIDVFGTKGVILLLATLLAISATILGRVWHAAWAGIPMGLCVIAFLPAVLPEKAGPPALGRLRNFLVETGRGWGLREGKYNPSEEGWGIAYLDESNYYYIKISNEPLDTGGQKRTLVLDNLIHGYFIKNEPERLDYDYEHIYALVTHRVMEDKAKAAGPDRLPADMPLSTLFLGGGSYTFPRYLQAEYPKTKADVAEIDPAVTEANHRALWLPRDTTIKTTWGDARQFVDNRPSGVKYDLIFGDAFNDFSVPWHLTTKQFNDRIKSLLNDDGVYMINIIDKYQSDGNAAFFALYKAEEQYVADALSAAGVADAKRMAKKVLLTIDDRKLGVGTTDFKRAAVKAVEKIDRIAPEATLERAIRAQFEKEKIPMRGSRAELIAAVTEVLKGDAAAKLLPERIPSWAEAIVEADLKYNDDAALPAAAAARGIHEARDFGSFLGSWVETARQTFGQNVYVFGTDSKPGNGQRETFVVVASMKPLDLTELGTRFSDPHFHDRHAQLVAPEAYDKEHMKAVKLRSRGIILTDDYAPVENLLAPVAKTRADAE